MKRVVTFLVVGLVAISTGGSNCSSTTGGDEDAGPTSNERLCTLDEDCGEFEECIGGICQRPCSSDDVCDFGLFCNRSGYCQTGCRGSDECGAMELCLEGVCRNQSEVGSCATKADCTDPPETNVCIEGTCQPPPAMCTGPQDCPGEQQCNGFERTCFNPNGDCMADNDCANKPQCQASGCTCTMDRRCVPTPTCTAADEATVCGVGSYCNLTTTPSRCAPAPTCQREADCASADLACNTGTHLCQRTASCTSNAQCTTSPFTQCNTTEGFCQQPSCLNGGRTCAAGEMCNMDGTCGPGNATPCTSDAQCPTSPTLQYCNATSQTCRNGCRNDSNCNAAIMEKCNGNHVCAVPTGSSSGGGGTGGGDGTPCQDDSECRAGYLCAPFTSVCREQCTPGACPVCPESGLTACFGGYCSSFGNDCP